MSIKRQIIAWTGITLLLALIAAAFVLANFSAISSRMERNSTLTSIGSNPENETLHPVQTGLIVPGEGRLARSLQKQLSGQLETHPQFGQIQPFSELLVPAGYPVLMVEIEPQQMLWTPVYARANLKVTIYYDSDGDVSLMPDDATKVKFIGDELTIQRSGEYTFTDASWGLMSRPGYLDYLAREIGKQISADLKAQNQ